MALFEPLRSLAKRRSVETVPTEIFVILVDDLYSALKSFAIGAAIGVLIGGIAAARTDTPRFIFSVHRDRIHRSRPRSPSDRVPQA